MAGHGLQAMEKIKDDYLANPDLLFITMWGFAHIGHFLRKGSVLDPFTWVCLFLALLLVADPGSWKRLAALAAMQLFYLFKEMPFTDNHMYIMGFINAGLLIASVSSYKEKNGYLPGLKVAMAYTSTVFLIAYFTAAFAKLNSGFFDPGNSCAVTMFYDSAAIISSSTFLPGEIESLMPYIVALSELSIPVLLLIRKARYTGIIVLIIFHIGISLSPSATALDFTIALFALSVPFLSREAKRDIINSVYSWSRKTAGFFTSLKYFYPLAVFFFLFLWKTASRFILIGIELYWILLAPFALIFGVIVIRTVIRRGIFSDLKRGDTPFLPLKPIHYGLILLLLFNAATPYLGIKTIGTFTMYSNLKTENGSSNHFLVKRYFDSMPLDDMVEIIRSDNIALSDFARSGQWITYHELRRILSENPETHVEYIRNGDVFSLSPGSDNFEPVRKDFFNHKFIGHRAYDPEEAVCLW